jgi:hypothetical protein
MRRTALTVMGPNFDRIIRDYVIQVGLTVKFIVSLG